VLYLEVVWIHAPSPSGYRDAAFSVCVSGDVVYGVGFDELLGYGRQRYRIEAIASVSGRPVARWVDEKSFPVAALLSCATYGGRVYAFGTAHSFWTVLVFDRYLNLVARVDLERPRFTPFSAVAGDGYIYVAGAEVMPTGSTVLRVLKLSPDDLTVVDSYAPNLGPVDSGAYAVDYSRALKQVVVGGFDRVDGVSRWRIEYLTPNLKPIKVLRPDVRGSVTGLSAGADGATYAVGRIRVVRLSRDGEVERLVSSPPAVKVYAAQDYVPSLGANVAVAATDEVYVLDGKSLSVVDGTRITRGPQVASMMVGSMVADSEKIYVAATAVAGFSWGWIVAALRPKRRGIFRR